MIKTHLPLQIGFLFFFAQIIFSFTCKAEPHLSNLEILKLAHKEARRLGRDPLGDWIKMERNLDQWSTCLPTKEDMETYRKIFDTKEEKLALKTLEDLFRHLGDKNYWTVNYSLHKDPGVTIMDGGLCVFLRASDGKVLGRYGMHVGNYIEK